MTDSRQVEVFAIDREGVEHHLRASPACSMMEVLRDASVGVAAICSGMLSCGTCHVFVDEVVGVGLPPPGDDEEALMSGLAHYRPERSRLSCQLRLEWVTESIRVHVAPEE